MNVGVICEEKYFDEIKKIVKNDAWKLYQIQTKPEAWLEMKENDYSLILVHTANYEEKYSQFLQVLDASLEETRLCFLCDSIPKDAFEQIVNQMGIAVFSLSRDPKSISQSLKKYLEGEAVFVRKDERFRALPFVEIRSENASFMARTVNLSISGAEIQGNISPLEKGDSVELIFKDAQENERKIPAIIRWVKWNSAKTKTESFGVEFKSEKNS
ncbi:MAG: PilZ domain-containing protein [Bdellovibrionota bacterium]